MSPVTIFSAILNKAKESGFIHKLTDDKMLIELQDWIDAGRYNEVLLNEDFLKSFFGTTQVCYCCKAKLLESHTMFCSRGLGKFSNPVENDKPACEEYAQVLINVENKLNFFTKWLYVDCE